MSRPIRQTAINLGQTALQTGSAPGVAIPEIQRALEQVLAAGSQAKEDTTAMLAKTGLDRTPYGANLLSGVNLQSLLAAAGILPAATAKYAGQGLTAAGVGTEVGIRGLSAATGAESSRGIAGTQADAQAYGADTSATAQILSSLFNASAHAYAGGG